VTQSVTGGITTQSVGTINQAYSTFGFACRYSL
jgi:hypothetical protein